MNEIQMEPSPPMIAKKLWKIVSIVFFMLREAISKSKLMVDLHYILKRGIKLAEKAIDNLVLHHNHLTCCPDDADLSFFSPREYEFSCSNSPAVPHFPSSSSSHYTNHYKRHHHYRRHNDSHDMATVNAVEEVRITDSPLPVFGRRSPLVRQLRITDSPFPLKDSEDSSQVDKAAEEFINKFYKELKQQKKKAALESPYHDMWFG